MRIGIIDLGTNSVRFDIHQIGPGKCAHRLLREKIMVRLGTGIFLNGKLDANAVQRTLQAFRRFKRLAERYRAKKIIAFGTSALRETTDREEFLSHIQERTGIQIRVISGLEEAKLIAHGILSGERRKHRFDRIKGPFALVDIGGGSTEISICRGKNILHSHSFPLGTARIQQLFLKKSPPAPLQVLEARQHIRNTIYETAKLDHWPRVRQVFGSSGTIRAVDRILKKKSHSDRMRRPEISKLVKDISSMGTTALLGIPGMEAKRVDMILAGSLIFTECMDVLGATSAEVTEFSLRDGILEEELELHRHGTSGSHLELHLSDLYEKTALLGMDANHLRRTVTIASELFLKLRPLHKLKPSWQVYLSAAMILRDTGEAININKHPLHSYYIVKNADLPAMDNWEIELIANLCLHHDGSKIGNGELSFTKGKLKRDAFLKLLAILRIADALDSGPESHLKLKTVRIAKKQVTLSYSGKDLTGLEALNIEKKSELFEKVFHRKISCRCGAS